MPKNLPFVYCFARVGRRWGVGRGLTGALLVLFALGAGPAPAQEVKLENVERWAFSGVRDVGGRYYYFTRLVDQKPGEVVLELYGRDLVRLSATTVNLGYYTSLRATGLAGEAALFFFQSGDKAQVLRFDAKGQKTGEATFVAESIFGSKVAIAAAGTGGDAYVAYPIQTGKKGFVVTRYGPDMKTKWQKEFAPEKGKFQLKEFAADDAHAFAVSDYSKEGWQVIVLDGATGADQGQQPLPIQGTDIKPHVAMLDRAGNLLLTGACSDQKTREPGFFALKTAASKGGPSFFNRTLFKTDDVAKLLHSPSTLTQLVANPVPSLKIHRLVERADGGYTAVGETYDDGGTTGSSPGTAVPFYRYVLDFAVLELSAQGKVETVRRIAKPFRVYQQQNGLGSFHGPDEFENGTAFSFRGLEAGTTPTLLFLNWHANQYYVNRVELKDSRENLFARTYFDQPVVPSAQERGEPTTYTFEYSPPTGKPAAELADTDILPHAPGKYLYYHYDRDRRTLAMKVLDAPVLKPLNK